MRPVPLSRLSLEYELKECNGVTGKTQAERTVRPLKMEAIFENHDSGTGLTDYSCKKIFMTSSESIVLRVGLGYSGSRGCTMIDWTRWM